MNLMGMDVKHKEYLGGRRHYNDIELWKDVTEEQWNDWLWQLTNTIKTLDDLKKVVNLTPEEEEGVRISTQTIPLNITPYYASLMNPDDPRCPIRLQSVPLSAEMNKTRYDLEDPLHEDEDSPVGIDASISGSRSIPCNEPMLHVLQILYSTPFLRSGWHGCSQEAA